MNEHRFMNTLSIKRMGMAIGATSTLLYVGCAFVMLTVPHEAALRFFNSILHGWDVEPIMRWDVPWWEAAIGSVEVFIIGWMVGAVIAMFYNLTADGKEDSDAR